MLSKVFLIDPWFMSWEGTAVIIVVVLQNSMDLLEGELGSSSKTCVTSTFDGNQVSGIEAEWVTEIKEEEDQEPTTIPEIKMEPKVSGVPVVSVCTFLVGCIQNCHPLYQCVLVKQKFDCRDWILSCFKKRNSYFATHCTWSTTSNGMFVLSRNRTFPNLKILITFAHKKISQTKN